MYIYIYIYIYIYDISSLRVNVRRWVDPRIIARPEGSRQWKFHWPHRKSKSNLGNSFQTFQANVVWIRQDQLPIDAAARPSRTHTSSTPLRRPKKPAKQGCINSANILEPPINPRRREGDIKWAPYRGHKYFRRHSPKLNRPSYLAPYTPHNFVLYEVRYAFYSVKFSRSCRSSA